MSTRYPDGRGWPVDENFLYSVLVKEPFNKSFKEIADFTDYQIVHILLRPKEEEKEEESEIEGESYTPQMLFESVWRSRGLSLDEIKEKWKKDFPDEPWGVEIASG